MAIPFPNIDPVAFALGPIEVRWYALAYLLGFILGAYYCGKLVLRNAHERPNKNDIEDFLTWVVVGVILGGRLGYVLFYQLSYFVQHPLEILMVWHGGMSFHGGLLGVAIAMLSFARLRKINVLCLSDIVCAAAPIGLLLGRLSNFANGELYGRITNVPWAMIFPNSDGQPRHPSQLYEAGLEGAALFLIIFALIYKANSLRYPGAVTGVFLLGYGTFRAIIEFMREPDANIGLFGDYISMGQILCLPMIILGLGFIIYSLRQKNHAPANPVPHS